MKRLLTLIILMVWGALLKAQVFTNQIASSGLPVNKGFVHAIFDYNNDGFEDLIYSVPVGSARYLTLYKNNGNTTFTNVTTTVGLPTNLLMSEAQGPVGVIASDYNNDGLKDLIVLQQPAGIKIYKNNCGLTFIDVTSALGIPSPLSSTTQITSFAVPSDFDKDGDVDYIISRKLANNNQVVTVIKNNLASNNFSFQDLFTVSNSSAFAAQIRSIDYDNDQDDDLLFIIQVPKASYAAGLGFSVLQTIQLYKNTSGSFTNSTLGSGLDEAYVRNGPIIFDYDNDGWLDVLYTSDDGYQSRWIDPNGASAITKFYRNIGKFNGGVVAFVDSSARNATDNLFPNTEAYYWFSSSMDFDNDADFDVFHGIGWCMITQHQLLKNNNNRFKDSAFAHGLNINGNVCAGNGANVWFDVDKDGDLDAFINDFNGDSYLMINPLNTQQAKYLRIKLSGCTSNKEARGAKVSVKLGNKYLTEYFGFSKGSNYNASDIFHFGLGNISTADSVIVYWPSGLKTQLGSTAANQLLFISEAACTNTQSLSFMLPDTLKTCGDSSIIDAGAGYTSYIWNTGSITSSIYAKATGWYKVTVSNGTCTATDSVYVSLVKAKITASKTRICKGETITLQADTNISANVACAKTDLPSNLQTGLVAYYPFCGNANDASGNGSNGTVFGATLTNDRFGKPSNAYHFNGISNYISAAHNPSMITNGTLTISCWFKSNSWIADGIERYLFSKQTGTGLGQIGYHGYLYGGSPGSPTKAATLRYRNGNSSTWGSVSYLFNNSYSVNDWVNLIFTYDNTKTSVYVNGVLMNFSTSVSLGESSNLLFIGSILGVNGYFNGDIDDFLIWNRVLTNTEINNYYKSNAPASYSWNTGATSNAISVTPTTTTKYYLTVNNGTSTCIDSVTIVVDSLPVPNLQDTLKVCGDSTILNPGSFTKYAWSNGDTTATITAKASGMYKVTVSNAVGCTATDSVYVSLVKAKITASKTRICKGETITLQADTTVGSLLACAKTDLPSNLQTGLVAYYPFCGNANDASGNGNNGTVNGATLTKDRFGKVNSAYSFNGVNNTIQIPLTNLINGKTYLTISTWVKTKSGSIFGNWSHNPVSGSVGLMYGLNPQGYFAGAIQHSLDITGTNINSIDTWHLLVVTYDGSISTPQQRIKAYVDGQLQNLSFGFNHQPASTIGSQAIDTYLGARQESLPTFLVDFFNGKIDEVGIWNRALSASEIQQYYNSSAPQTQTYTWNIGATSNAISVTPTTTTKYYLTVNNGTSTCIDSVTIVVDTISPPTLPNNLNACGDSVLLNPASNGKYLWNTGDTTASIYAKATGTYKVSITNGVCAATDSVNISLLKAKIIASKLRICKGDSVTLGSNSSNLQLKQCDKSGLAPNLQNGLVGYWPFCGNANDASGNGNNGTVNGATLTTDRYGRVNSAYSFNGVSNYINLNNSELIDSLNDFSILIWVNANNLSNQFQHLVSKDTMGLPPNGDWDLYLNYNKVKFEFNLNSNNYSLNTNNNLIPNKWNCIFVKRNSLNGLLELYLNGIFESSINAFIGPVFNKQKLSIGNQGSSSQHFFNGKLDDIGIWNRALSASEIQQLYASGSPQSQTYNWSTINTNLGTDTLLKVTPTTTTKYYLTVNNGISSCIDSVTIVVDSLPVPNLQDTLKVCGDSAILNPGSFAKYAWSNGDTTATLTAKASGMYKVTVSNAAGCTATDSVYVSLVKAKITASKTRICKGETITLQADTTVGSLLACAKTDLPSNLQTGLVAYYPFCGNANDASGNGNNGIVNGATLTTDRFGRASSAYSFNGTSDFINVNSNILNNSLLTMSVWVNSKNRNFANNFFPNNILSNDNPGSYGQGFGVNLNNLTSKITIEFFYGFKEISYPIIADTWYLVTVVYSNNNLKTFINGVMIDDTNYSTGASTGLLSFNIGKHNNDISTYDNRRFFNGKLDDILIWNHSLTASEIQQYYSSSSHQTQNYSWNTSATSNAISVTPTTTTKYYLTVNNGTSTCIDSVTIVVDSLPVPNLQDTLKVCGDSAILNPGSFTKYAWSNGDTTATLTAKASGMYKVTVSNAVGCTATDSVYVSLVKAKITASKTRICKGDSVTLGSNSSNLQLKQCDKSGLAPNLQNGLVGYWPFCGNANDASGNGNHGTVNGATLTTDRYGNANSSYSFDGVSNYISTNTSIPEGSNAKSINLWVKFNSNSDRGWLVSNNTCINGSQYNGFGIFQEGPLNKILFYGMTGGDVDFSFPIQTNKYYNIVCTFSDDTLKIYVDGQIKASSYNPLQTIGNNGLLIGKRFLGNLPPPCGWDNGSNGLFNGSLDDIGIWNRALSASEIQQLYASGSPQSQTYNWTTINTNLGTDTLLKVTPTTTTKYYLTVNNGTSNCIDSVTIVVDSLPVPNLQDTLKVCGDSALLNPGSFAKYAWSNGDTTATLTAKASGMYKVTVSNAAGCTATDSVYVSLVKAKITASKTRICKGDSVTLGSNSSNLQLKQCDKSGLAPNLQNGLVGYWPFCGNANDASGNGNNGTVNGATLTTDRYGNANSAYSFNSQFLGGNSGSDYIRCINPGPTGNKSRTISFWAKTNTTNTQNLNNSLIGYGSNALPGKDFRVVLGGICGSSGLAFHNNSGQGGFLKEINANLNNQWDFYTIVYDSLFGKNSAAIFIYKNSILISTLCGFQNGVDINTSNTNPITFGRYHFLGHPSSGFYKGLLDDIGIWNRALSASEIQQLYASGSPQSQTYNWSTINTNLGTDTLLKVTPTTTTKYYLTVNNGTSSCIDSVTIVVDELPNAAIPKNIKYCGDSIRILPDTNFVSYLWNTGRSSKTIYADTSGWYKLTVTDANGCINKDSSLVSVIKSKIIAPITNTCYGSSLFLYADTLAKKSKLYPSNISWLPNNETTSKITMNGLSGAYYKLIVSNTVHSCRDSVLITVNALPIPSVPKNIKYCGDSIRIIPDTNFVSYVWNTGRSSKTIHADTSGWYKLTVTDVNGCINKDSSLVSVIKSKIIAPITNTCYGSPLFLYADTLAKKSKLYPSNISWLPNNETTSKIKLTGLIGGYNKLQVSDGIQTCRDSVLITVNALPVPLVPKNIKYCGDSIRIIPDTNFVSYVWNTGKSSKTIYADTSGWYKLTVTDANACVNKDSSLVSVIKAEIKSDTITLCKGNHVNLKAIYKNLQSIVYPDQLLWSTTEQTPVIQVSPLTNSTYNLTVSNAIGGICSTQVALTVNNITADLFGEDTLYVCNDSAIVTALNGLHNFVWKPLTSNTQQVVVKQNGWVYLTAQNANNCLSSDSIYVYFTNTDFQLSDTVVCSGAGIITANPIEKGGTFIGTHVVNNQFTIPSKGGLYNITYSINNGTCTKTTTKWIRVIQRKDPTFVASTNKLCRADGPVQFTFSDTSGLFYKDNLLYTSKQFLADKVGKYIFKYEVRSEMCIDSNNQTIEVIERPNANFNPSKLIACVGDLPIQLNPEVNGGLFTGQYVKQNTFDPQKSGNYPILYKISNQLCNDSNIKTIKVYDKPVGSITYTPPMPFMNDTVSFTFNGSKVSQYIWEFGNAASPETSKLANPKVEYLGFGIQNVSLSVIDSQGCSATFTRNVKVQNRSTLFVPNAFTPTSDGNNEYFLAVGDGIISYKMLIFNRWGELIFESNDINKGWDGKFQGVFCPSGVYTCFVNAVGSDNQTYQFNGTVTLIR